MERLQARNLLLIGRHHNFATNLVWNIVLLTEFRHQTYAADGQLRFEGTWRVVESAVKNTAIVGALMLTRRTLFLKDCNI